jgi:segregation and condensation protein A
MTSEDSESSKKSSGERSEPRDSDSPEPPTDESETSGGSKHRADGGTTDEIPLNIAGHDAEKERRENGEGADADEDAEANGTDPNAESDGDGAVLSGFDVSATEADDEEVEPVELLVQLADEGEIDPWDIDVVTVTDKFLDRLDEADLRTGGRALFYASVLLRMKSDAMWHDDEPEEAFEEEPWETEPMDGEGAPAVDPFDQLEAEMDRRIERKRARGTPETLDELVRDLRERERDTWWKESRTYDTSESPSGYGRGTQTLDYHAGDDFRMDDEPTADDVTGTAHDEHMEDIINDVYVAVQRHYDGGRDEVLFAEVREAGGSRVDTFLGLLFLAHRGQVRLEQDEPFGDLWIQDPSAVGGEQAAPADD